MTPRPSVASSAESARRGADWSATHLLHLSAARIAAGEVSLRSAPRPTAPDGRIVVIAPFIRDNHVTPDHERDPERPGDIDLILVAHARGDHFGDTAELSGMTRAPPGVNTDFGSAPGAPGMLPG